MPGKRFHDVTSVVVAVQVQEDHRLVLALAGSSGVPCLAGARHAALG